jgi:transcriptional regulator GlxA family with amidase domain
MKQLDLRETVTRLLIAMVLLASAFPVAARAAQPPAAREVLYEAHPAPAARTKTVGVLIFPGFEVLDAYGPIEMWGSLKHAPARFWGGEEKRVSVRVVTIAAKRGEISSNQGPKTVADYGYDNAPHLDYLLVPGGIGVLPLLKDPATLNWLRGQAGRSDIVMSVCTGASLLAAAGILDGRPATTNKMVFEQAAEPGPKVKWVKKARWVDDGTVVTASGVSAGIDMSLAVISRLYGKDMAAWLERVAEYDAHHDPSWDPFAVKAGLMEQ